jgi:hypothetical protein
MVDLLFYVQKFDHDDVAALHSLQTRVSDSVDMAGNIDA